MDIITSAGETLHAERHEQLIPVAQIEHAQRFQDYCRACPHYDKNFSCPPNTPDFTSYVGQARTARVICLRIPLSSAEAANVELQMKIVRDAGKSLGEELRTYLKQGHKVAGAGFCQACPTFAAENGKSICNKPAERIFSLEAMGVDVNALLKASFGFGLEWNKGTDRANYLCVVGAVFYDEAMPLIKPA